MTRWLGRLRRYGIPLAISPTGGNRNDVTQLLPLIDGVGPVRGNVGRPRQRAERVLADRGYDHDKYRRELRKRGVRPVIALGCAVVCQRLIVDDRIVEGLQIDEPDPPTIQATVSPGPQTPKQISPNLKPRPRHGSRTLRDRF